eukprot:jgi/Ulvmu1/10715/UM067_0042.1
MHPGIDTSARALKFLAALQDQVGFKGAKEVVWRLAKPAVAAEPFGTSRAASRMPAPHHASLDAMRSCGADVMTDKAPGLKRVEEFLRCAASNEATGVAQMVLPLLEALLGSDDGGSGSLQLMDRAMSDVLTQVSPAFNKFKWLNCR